MLYSFARVSAVLKLKVDDYYHSGARRRLRTLKGVIRPKALLAAKTYANTL
jgi:hypothetical protein